MLEVHTNYGGRILGYVLRESERNVAAFSSRIGSGSVCLSPCVVPTHERSRFENGW